MRFGDICFPEDIETVNKTEENPDGLDIHRYNIELDFAEQYEDEHGILHIKTFFNHDEMDESDLWEVFVPENGAHALELLLNDD